jgi:NAD(P)-dependent dehydrogenase (short-subunit alcohol dehydrogenase family)
MNDNKPLTGKVVLVTGASRGIGYYAALEAGRRGAHVIALARTVGGLEDLDDAIKATGGETTLVPLDIRDGDGIDRLGAAIFERWGHLDGLIGNAGVLGPVSPVGHVDPKDFDKAFAINVTANYRLIRSMDLLLRQSPAGRAVFLTSGAAEAMQPYWSVYAASKAALEALVRTYAAEVATTPVRVNLFSPGALRTAMRAAGFPGEDPETLQSPQVVAADLMRMISPDYAENGALFHFPSRQTRPLVQKPFTERRTN